MQITRITWSGQLPVELGEKRTISSLLYRVKDWGFAYRKISDRQFHLHYWSMDVGLIYDSAVPTAGWVPAREPAGELVPMMDYPWDVFH